MMARGLRTLVHRPSLFEGAAISTAPLVGDVRITYSYPAYTGLPPRTVEGSTGDVAAVKGTRVRIETHPLRAARKALLLLGETGEKGEIGGVAVGKRADRRADADRGRELPLLAAAAARARRARGAQPSSDRRGRRAAAGRDPGPGRPAGAGDAAARSRSGTRPATTTASASSSWSTAPAIAPSSASLLRDGARRAHGPGAHAVGSGVGGPGRRRAHRLPDRGARSRRRVGRPGGRVGKSGSSRTLYVIIQNPHESLEDRLERQRELLEKLIGDLAKRLEHDRPGRRRRRAGARRLRDARTTRRSRTWRCSAS